MYYDIGPWGQTNKYLRMCNLKLVLAWKAYWGGKLSTVDLFVLTSLDKLILILKILFSFFTKQAALMRRSTVLSLSPQLIFPGCREARGRFVKQKSFKSDWIHNNHCYHLGHCFVCCLSLTQTVTIKLYTDWHILPFLPQFQQQRQGSNPQLLDNDAIILPLYYCRWLTESQVS